MTQTFTMALIFLMNAFFSAVIYLFLFRLLFEWTGVDFYNSLSQVIHKFTQPVLKRLQRFLPSWRGFNFAVLAVLLALMIFKMWLLQIFLGLPFDASIFLWAFAEIFSDLIQIISFAIVAVVLISWISPHQHNVFTSVLHKMTAPLLSIARRKIPPLGGLDFSPVVVLLGLQLAKICVLGIIGSL